jgi:uncharacterized membrane protein
MASNIWLQNAERRKTQLFLFRGKESHPRSLLKAISWRALGSIDTFILGLVFTSNIKAAGSIAGTEVITKIFLYYFHERAWAMSSWGHVSEEEQAEMAFEMAPAKG